MTEHASRSQPMMLAFVRRHLTDFIILLVILLMVILFQANNSRFLSLGNLANIGRQTSYLTIFAVAQAMVLMVRGFDLSLGPTVSLVSVVTAVAMTSFTDPAAAITFGILAGLGAAAVVGLFNGVAVAIVGLNPFVATLATMNIVIAVATTYTGGFPVAGLPDAFGVLAFSTPLGIPIQVWIVAGLLLAFHFVQNWTVHGRSRVLIGSNPRAAKMAGVNVRLHLLATYLICSLTIGIGAILLTARTASGEPNLGGNLTLQAIAAAVLGGMSPMGGRGKLTAPILGALVLAILSNGMGAAAINGYLQQVILGAVIIAALAVDRFQRS